MSWPEELAENTFNAPFDSGRYIVCHVRDHTMENIEMFKSLEMLESYLFKRFNLLIEFVYRQYFEKFSSCMYDRF